MNNEPIPTGEQFGRYSVYERIGAGGMATVHRAKKHGIAGFERQVALKRMLAHLAENPAFVESFIREAKVASLLAHPNIGQIYDFGRIDGVYYIAMELIEGVDLRKVLRQACRLGHPIPLGVVLSILCELCDALEYAHTFTDEQGTPLNIVHRDVSPSNLLLSNTGHLKVIDFGIAKVSMRQLHTESGQVKGKLGYMSPEAAMGHVLGPVSDVFSAGVIAHELLTLMPLFSSKTDFETMLKIREGEIAPPSSRNPQCPPELDELVMAALSRNPHTRLPTAGTFRHGLDTVAARSDLRLSAREVVEWMGSAGLLDGAPGVGRNTYPGRSGQFGFSNAFSLGGGSSQTGRPSTRGAASSQNLDPAEAWGDVSDPQRSPPRSSSGTQPPLYSSQTHSRSGQLGLDPTLAPGSMPTPSPMPLAPAPQPTKKGLWLVLGGLALVAAGLAVYLVAGGSKQKQEPPVAAATGASVQFTIEPEGAIIEIGGKEVGKSPYEAKLEPGVYSIVLRSEGYLPHRNSLTVRAGEKQNVNLALEKAPAVAVTDDAAGRGSGTETSPTPAPSRTPGATAAPRPQPAPQPQLGQNTGAIRRPTPPAGGTAPKQARAGKEADDDDSVTITDTPAPVPTPTPPPPTRETPAPAPTREPPQLTTLPTPPKTPPKPARVPVVGGGAVTKLSGEIPTIKGATDVSSVIAKVCIDARGSVTDVTIKGPAEVAGQLQTALRSWRYKPYAPSGSAEPVCFPVTMQLRKGRE